MKEENKDNNIDQQCLKKLLAFHIALRSKCDPEKDYKKIISYNGSIYKILKQLKAETGQNYYGA